MLQESSSLFNNKEMVMNPNSNSMADSRFSISSRTSIISSEPLNSNSHTDLAPIPIGSGDETSPLCTSEAIEKSSSSPARVLSGLATAFKFAARVLATIVGVALYGAGMVASGILTVVSIFLLTGPGVVTGMFGAGVGALYGAKYDVPLTEDQMEGYASEVDDPSIIKGATIGVAVPWAVIQLGLGVPRALCAGVGLVGAGLLSFGLNKEFKTFSEYIQDANFELSIGLSKVGLINYEGYGPVESADPSANL